MPELIDNPILNGPYDPPARHFRFDDDGITNEIVDSRRDSGYFVPIPASRRRGAQLAIDQQTADREELNDFVNQVRGRVALWRDRGWPHVTPTTVTANSAFRTPALEPNVAYTVSGETPASAASAVTVVSA